MPGGVEGPTELYRLFDVPNALPRTITPRRNFSVSQRACSRPNSRICDFTAGSRYRLGMVPFFPQRKTISVATLTSDTRISKLAIQHEKGNLTNTKMNSQLKTILSGTALLVAFLAPGTALAGLGATESETEARYGKGKEITAEPPATLARMYEQTGISIKAEFINGLVQKLTVTKQGKFTDEEINRWLKENAQGSSWSEVPQKLNPVAKSLVMRDWRRGDRGGASVHSGEKSSELMMMSGVFQSALLQQQGNSSPRVSPGP